MGGPNKLLLPIGTTCLVTQAAGALVDAGLNPVVAVLGRDAEEVAGALAALPVQTVVNPAWREGMGRSLAAGIAGLPPQMTAVAVSLGDLWALRPTTAAHVVAAFQNSPRGIAVPVYNGRRGHPVVFDLLRYRSFLLQLAGDQGARSLLAQVPGDVLEVVVDDPGVVLDVDTPDDYSRAARKSRPESLRGQGLQRTGSRRLR